MKVIADFRVLMQLAGKAGRAKVLQRQGYIPVEEMAEAIKAHEDYQKICLQADEMTTGMTRRDIC